MARVTIEDCLKNVDNMYELVHLATKRTRQLFKGAEPLVKSKNRIIVTALREIASGAVRAQLKSEVLPEDGKDELPPMPH
jgi:DNA-directed RNA polymerase subunit omega